jgi:peroxiredoxin
MRRPTRDLVIVLLILAALGCACEQKRAPAVPGNPAPAFNLKDPSGSTVHLRDFAGKVVVIDFWATWCGPCKEATKELEGLHSQYGSRAVVVVGISIDKGADAATKVREFVAEHGLTYRVIIDDGSAYKAYGITRIPATIIIDRQHIIRESYPGYRSGLGKEIALDIEKYL